jgi:CheY-like chemotaxis protein
VITDVGMPVMDGLALLHRIRRSEELTHLPAILCSGNDGHRDDEESLGAWMRPLPCKAGPFGVSV